MLHTWGLLGSPAGPLFLGNSSPKHAVRTFSPGIHVQPWPPGRAAERLECPCHPWPVSTYPDRLLLRLASLLSRLSVPPHAWPGPMVPPTDPRLPRNPLITHAFWWASPLKKCERLRTPLKFLCNTRGYPGNAGTLVPLRECSPTPQIFGRFCGGNTVGNSCWQQFMVEIAVFA